MAKQPWLWWTVLYSQADLSGGKHLRVLVVERPMKKVRRLPPRLEFVDVAVDNLLKPAWSEGAAAAKAPQ